MALKNLPIEIKPMVTSECWTFITNIIAHI